jgi:MFS family permease
MFKLLRQRNFGLLWFAGLISMIGDWVLFIALPIYAYSLTQSSLAMGIMFMAGTLPRILFGSVAGVFVDRWDRKWTMVAADLSRALLLLFLLLVRSPEWMWIVYVVAFLQSTISQFFDPAENALLPRLVDSSQLVAANSLNVLNNNLARLGGPALGGLLLGSFGFTNVVFIDSLSFLLSGVMIASIILPTANLEVEGSGEPGARFALEAEARVWQEWLSGLRFIVKNQVVSVIFLVMAVAGIAEGLFNVMFVIFVRKGFAGGALQFGWLTSAQAIGGLIGGLLIGWIGSRAQARRLVPLIAVNGLLILLLVNLPSLPMAILLIFLAGIPIVGYSVGVGTLLQRHVADHYRGRVFGALGTSMAIFTFLGQGLATLLGDHLGAVTMLTFKGLLDIAAGLLAIFLFYSFNLAQANLEMDRSLSE